MKRKRTGKQCKEEAMDEVNPICGLKNSSHRHCHLLSVLHLLAQIKVPAQSPLDTVFYSQQSPPHLGQFFDQYSKGASFFPHQIVQNPSSFGVDQFPDRPADLIRLFVNIFSQADSAVNFKTVLEWSFECHACNRFTRTRIQETLLRIDAREAASFEQMLGKFLAKRKCICGALCTSQPSMTSSGGDFLFFDLDRSSSKSSASWEEEVSLFPLRLQRSYNILGSIYKVFATINLNLDYAEGGHYSTNVFVGDEDELICVHEERFDLIAACPSFDSTTVVVALRKEANNEPLEEKDGSVEVGEESSLPSPPFCNVGQGDLSPLLWAQKSPVRVKLRIAKLIQFSFLGWPADGVLGAEQMLKRSVNGEDGSVQANSSLNQSKHEQSQEEEEEEEGGGELAYPDDFCAGSQDLTSTSNLTKRSRQVARDETMTRLIGDNLRIYLNDDPEIVARYKEEYLREEEEKLSRWFCKAAATEEVGLKSLGSSVLESKVYKV